jgi:hypothetical protein
MITSMSGRAFEFEDRFFHGCGCIPLKNKDKKDSLKKKGGAVCTPFLFILKFSFCRWAVLDKIFFPIIFKRETFICFFWEVSYGKTRGEM